MALPVRRYRIIGDYMVGKKLGAGSFSTVWHARHRVHGTDVAIKEIVTARLDARTQKSLKSEIDILKKVNHPNIVHLHDMIEESGKIYIVLEFCKGGDLSMYIRRQQGKIPEATAKHFMQQLAEGLKVLRENNLIHRDLKPQNLLLSTTDDNSILKIADFGFARSLQPRLLAETLCGSPLYMAPEIMQHQRYDAKADLWSVGIILFQLVTGGTPFTGNSELELLQNIMKSVELRFPPEANNLSPHCLDLCRKLLRCNPVERLTFEEFFNHPYLSDRQPDECFIRKKAESSQGDCLPFSLDEDSSRPDSTPLLPRRSTMRSMYGFSLDTIKTTDLGSLVVDSLDSIEQEYVIVSGPLLNLSTSACASKPSRFPSKTDSLSRDSGNMNATSGSVLIGGATGGYAGGLGSGTSIARSSQGPVDIADTSEQPSTDCMTEIKSLEHYASSIRELVNEKIEGGKQLEAFSFQLVVLAIWKQALRVCHTHATSAIEGSSSQETTRSREVSKVQHSPDAQECVDIANTQELQDISSQIERAFLREVGNAEELAKVIESGNTEMPDAMELIYQSALALGRRGAVDEYMGDTEHAAVFYSKAVRLLQFLLVEAPCLILNPPFSLTNSDRYRIQNYINILNNRQSISQSQRMALFKAEDRACPS